MPNNLVSGIGKRTHSTHRTRCVSLHDVGGINAEQNPESAPQLAPKPTHPRLIDRPSAPCYMHCCAEKQDDRQTAPNKQKLQSVQKVLRHYIRPIANESLQSGPKTKTNTHKIYCSRHLQHNDDCALKTAIVRSYCSFCFFSKLQL